MGKRRKIVGTGDLRARLERFPEDVKEGDVLVASLGHYGHRRFVERSRLRATVTRVYSDGSGFLASAGGYVHNLNFAPRGVPTWDEGALLAVL